MMQIINQMLVLLILMVIGYIAGKKGIINQVTNEKLSKVVINVILPALTMDLIVGTGDTISSQDAFICILASTLYYILALFISLVTTKLMRTKEEDAGTYQFMLIFGNVGFMGIPVINSILGPEAAFYCSLCNIPFNLIVYSVGLFLLTKKSGKNEFSLKRLINMPFITCIVALILFLINFKMPIPLATAFETLGAANTPLAMLIIGGALSMVPIKELFTQWRIYVITFIKLLVFPMVTWLIYRMFLPSDSLLLSVIVILAGMPIATNATMMTIEFGGNQQLVAKGLFFTSVLCVFTIPVISYILLSI